MKPLTAIFSLSLLAMVWATPALGLDQPAMQETSAPKQLPKQSPVDFRACNFRDGKGMKDLELVNAKFRDYANKNDFEYAAWVLVPQYHNGVDFDVGWLGAWPDGEAFGVSMDIWRRKGNALAAEYNQVMDCTLRHEMAGSLPINAPEATPANGVVMFYPCTLKKGKTLKDAYAAHLKAGQLMKAMGSLAMSWFYTPALGTENINYDYYHVVAFSRYSDMGATMEMYVNGGGRDEQQKILSSVATCRTPTVLDALSVRDRDER